MGNLPTLRWTWDSRPALNSNSSDTCIALSFPVTINPLALLVLAKGVEPLSSGASNQRSDRLSYTSKFMAGRAGFEPTRCTSSNTQGVWTSPSSAWIPSNIFWWAGLDSNQRIVTERGLQPPAIAAMRPTQILVLQSGLEPLASRL